MTNRGKPFPLILLLASAAAADNADTAMERAKAGAFDARGQIECAQEAGEELGACDAAVARADDGSAVVRVTFPNGFSRMLIFEESAFKRGNATMSGVGTDTEWQLSNGMYLIRVDDQQYRLPEAVVFGQ